MKIVSPREQINWNVLQHKRLMQCCSDLQQIRIYVGNVISECIHGKWACVCYESDEFYERREYIKKSIELVLGLRASLAERAEDKSTIYRFIDSNLGLMENFGG